MSETPDERCDAVLGAARSAEAAGRFDEAEKGLRRAASMRPGARSRLELARFFEARGRQEDALAEARAAAVSSPRCAEAWLAAGRLSGALGRETEALEAFSRAATLRPGDAEAWLERGRFLQRWGRSGDAQKAFSRAAALAPGRVAPKRGALEQAVAEGRWAEAALVAQEAAAVEADVPRWCRPWDRTPAPPRAQGEGPARFWTALWRASALADRERFDSALAALPTGPRWVSHLEGRIRLRGGDAAGALKAFDAALAGEPRHWHTAAFAAEAALCVGRSSAAKARMRTAARLATAPGDAADRLAWEGELALWAGDARRALPLLKAAQAAGAPLALGWLGAALLLLGRPEEALAVLERAREARPDDEEAEVWLGETLLRLGRPEETVRRLGKTAGRGHPWALVVLALALRRIGRRREARRAFSRIPADWRNAWKAAGGRGFEGVLEAGLRVARGVRRPESYAQLVWARPKRCVT